MKINRKYAYIVRGHYFKLKSPLHWIGHFQGFDKTAPVLLLLQILWKGAQKCWRHFPPAVLHVPAVLK